MATNKTCDACGVVISEGCGITLEYAIHTALHRGNRTMLDLCNEGTNNCYYQLLKSIRTILPTFQKKDLL
jgi:hypothetical protein